MRDRLLPLLLLQLLLLVGCLAQGLDTAQQRLEKEAQHIQKQVEKGLNHAGMDFEKDMGVKNEKDLERDFEANVQAQITV